ncbi:MAG: MFS transporter [Acidobacteria bacterium]|nr:MFS transporter [Acidobacteriota bacterium]
MASIDTSLPWYRQVNREQWRAFIATFGGWILDGFDFTILTFIIIDIQREFSVTSAAAGLLGTVTMLTRLVGGVAAGTAADKWGRKGPLMLSILWFSVFAFLCGFSTSYAMLFTFRALFGIGMGGEWAAGMPLALEHWPAHLRGIASGILQGGFSWGFMLSSFVFQFVYPTFDSASGAAWRAMFWIGVLPALLVLWIRTGVTESPVWLERQKHLKETQKKDDVSLIRILKPDLIGVTIQTSVLMGAFIFSYHSTSFWYPTYLREGGFQPFWYLIALNAGGIIGSILWGRVSETNLGRRGSATVGAIMGIAMIPLFLMTRAPSVMFFGALLIGIGGPGMWGIIPTYLSERFPTAARGVGPGFAYHAGAAIGAITPTLIGGLRDRGFGLSTAMAVFIAISNVLAVIMLWLGPETRGHKFEALDDVKLHPQEAQKV